VILEDSAVELLNVLVPHLAGIHVERVVASGRVVRLEAATRGSEAACPACGQASRRVHSRYERWLADRGVGGRAVSIRLQVRRFFCGGHHCPRRILAEQVSGLITVGARLDGGRASYVAEATTRDGTPAVLRVSIPPGIDEFTPFDRQLAALRLAGGDPACRADPARRAAPGPAAGAPRPADGRLTAGQARLGTLDEAAAGMATFGH
jgi:zinc-finger of transposase IS204/IS1001/IS1096/IS1165